eukprot:m.233338 g.233338  ORF g.233338 m.233338 type:complete len:483 (+) comp19067_c0_seq1:610-2058(+)
MLLALLALTASLVVAAIWITLLVLRSYVRQAAAKSAVSKEIREKNNGKSNVTYLGIFHPYCNAGGGGERVLWCSVAALQESAPNVHCVIYTGDAEGAEEMITQAYGRFGVRLNPSTISFVHLKTRKWVEASTYPHFTMIGQSLGSMLLGWEALTQFLPDVFYDSMGYAFTFPLFSLLARCKIICYVHYPTISTDMLSRVEQRTVGVNNNNTTANSSWRSTAKILYYRCFAALYRFVGSYAELIMVNSTWTSNHIVHIWRNPTRTHIVYPPCDTASLQQLPLPARIPTIVSVAQFRPEKNHSLQIESLARLFTEHPEHKGRVRLVMVGGCRNKEDEDRVAALKALAALRGLKEGPGAEVEVWVNAPIDGLRKLLGSGLVGLHTMCDEHFGIGIVEYMAAGMIALAHDSGGPRSDIVVDATPRTGFRAHNAETYATTLHTILTLSTDEQLAIQAAGRASVANRFSEEAFKTKFVELLTPLLARS